MHANIDYECLEKCYRSIDELMKSCSGNEIANNEKMLTDAVGLVLDAGKLAAKEGLLALEEYCNTLPDQAPVGYFKKMLNNCIDGAEPLLLKGFAMNRFCASRLDGYMGLAYLIYLEGVLEIQAGVHPNVIAMGLETMLPENLADLYKISNQQRNDEREEERKKRVDELFEGGMGMKPHQDGFVIMNFLDLTLASLDDRSVQRVLRDVDNKECAYIMKAISGRGRKMILTNVSEQLAKMLAEDYDWMGAIRTTKATTAGIKMIDSIYKLVSSGEIKIDNKEEMLFFDKLMKADKDYIMHKSSKDKDVDELTEMLNQMRDDYI